MKLFLSVIFLYGIFNLIALAIYPKLLYFPPPKQPYLPPNHIYVPLDNGHIYLSFYENPTAKYTIIFSHGNAEDLYSLHPFLSLLQNYGYQVIAWDYRGYGMSAGPMSASQTTQDILTVYDYAVNMLNIPSEQIIAFGRSLGASHALFLGTKRPVHRIVLESPFVTLHQVVTHYKLLLVDPYPNIDWIKKISTPTLIIHGHDDRLISKEHALILDKHCKSCTLRLIKGAGHNDIAHTLGHINYLDIIAGFIRKKDQPE